MILTMNTVSGNTTNRLVLFNGKPLYLRWGGRRNSMWYFSEICCSYVTCNSTVTIHFPVLKWIKTHRVRWPIVFSSARLGTDPLCWPWWLLLTCKVQLPWRKTNKLTTKRLQATRNISIDTTAVAIVTVLCLCVLAWRTGTANAVCKDLINEQCSLFLAYFSILREENRLIRRNVCVFSSNCGINFSMYGCQYESRSCADHFLAVILSFCDFQQRDDGRVNMWGGRKASDVWNDTCR